jgi:hypothetical protein
VRQETHPTHFLASELAAAPELRWRPRGGQAPASGALPVKTGDLSGAGAAALGAGIRRSR